MARASTRSRKCWEALTSKNSGKNPKPLKQREISCPLLGLRFKLFFLQCSSWLSMNQLLQAMKSNICVLLSLGMRERRGWRTNDMISNTFKHGGHIPLPTLPHLLTLMEGPYLMSPRAVGKIKLLTYFNEITMETFLIHFGLFQYYGTKLVSTIKPWPLSLNGVDFKC